ncbi:MAG TPA: head GIN domain-containing protein [Chitinophagaceae bacterium]|nr:head GIN domain-containing protein [Chitinophagaceae bacterium]
MRNTLFAVVCFALLFSSCDYMWGKKVTGSGVSSTRQRNLGNFSGLEVSGPMKVYISQSPSSSIKIEADENLMEYIETEKDGNYLDISTRRGYNLRPRAGIKIYITAPSFERLAVTGSGELRTQTKISSNKNIETSVTGSGDIILDIDAPEISSNITGSGNIRVNGTTKTFLSEVTGSGEIHAFDLLSETANVEISGSGDVEIFASKQLNVTIAGSGDVKYKGNPSVNKSVAGSGDIRKM